MDAGFLVVIIDIFKDYTTVIMVQFSKYVINDWIIYLKQDTMISRLFMCKTIKIVSEWING